MELKKALITDIIALKKICEDAYALNFHDHWNDGGLAWYLDHEFSTERLSSDLADENIIYYFIKHRSEVVGFVKIRIEAPTCLSFTNSVELEKIYVLPACKGLGIGKAALNEIINRFRESGKKGIHLSVIDTNQSAIAFYKKLGFEFHSRTTLDVPYFKEELRGMHRMMKILNR